MAVLQSREWTDTAADKPCLRSAESYVGMMMAGIGMEGLLVGYTAVDCIEAIRARPTAINLR